jgi:hypothetical protein
MRDPSRAIEPVATGHPHRRRSGRIGDAPRDITMRDRTPHTGAHGIVSDDIASITGKHPNATIWPAVRDAQLASKFLGRHHSSFGPRDLSR